MALIYESPNFIIESHERPEVDRLDGGHIKVSAKSNELKSRTDLTPKQAIEMVRLTVVAGKAMKRAMAGVGVEIGRINYQENGNWKPHLHVHLYCRAKNAKYQKFGDPIKPGNKPEYEPLTEEDIKRVKKEVESLMNKNEFSDEVWGLD